MGFKFGNASRGRLATCHQDIQLIMQTAIGISDIDFGIAFGHRSIEEQKELYAKGRTTSGDIVTNCDGIPRESGGAGKSKHNFTPSKAADIYIWVNGSASWDREHLIYVGGVIMAVYHLLKAAGKISITLRWGGNWDQDGEIISDQTFMDLPHFEIVE